MDQKEFLDELKKVEGKKRLELTDEMMDQVAGGFYSNWGDLDKKTQMRLQQESMTAMALGEYCEIFNTESSVEYQG